MEKSGAVTRFVVESEVHMKSALAWMNNTALTRRANLRMTGVPIVAMSSVREFDWDAFSFTS